MLICKYFFSYRWDIRDASKKPAITRSAHNGEVYSVDLNTYSSYLFLSGG